MSLRFPHTYDAWFVFTIQLFTGGHMSYLSSYVFTFLDVFKSATISAWKTMFICTPSVYRGLVCYLCLLRIGMSKTSCLHG